MCKFSEENMIYFVLTKNDISYFSRRCVYKCRGYLMMQLPVMKGRIMRTTSIHEGEDDEDIPTVDITAAPTPPHVPQLQGSFARARARQLSCQVLSFLGTLFNTHKNTMMPKLDVFILLRNDGPSMDKKDNHRA
jgi:hypothetical protein